MARNARQKAAQQRRRARERAAKAGRGNIQLRGLSNARYRGFKPLGPTNSFYHNSIPRTLQIATRRPMSAKLRFVKNYTIKISPSLRTEQQSNPGTPQITNIQFRANSLNNLVQTATTSSAHQGWIAAGATDFEFQDGNNNFTAGMVQHAEGAEPNGDWANRFAEYTVLGSKCSVTWNSMIGGASGQITPASCYIQLTGSRDNIQDSTDMALVNKKPYTRRARIMCGNSQTNGGGVSASIPGARLTSFYSCKKFEGVTDPADNPQLRGHFTNVLQPSPQNYGAPVEASYYNVGYCPTFPMTNTVPGNGLPAPVVMTVRLEYIVKLSEPTLTNQTSQLPTA